MRSKGFLAAALVLMTLAAIGCSSSSATPGPGYYPNDLSQATKAGLLPDDNPLGPTPAPAASAAEGADSGGGVTLQTGAPGAAAPEDRIIKTGSVTIEVADIDISVAQATDQMHVLGGWMAASDRTTSAGASLASVTYRVPVARFEDAVGLMRKLGKKVIAEHSDSQSVGGQIVDLQARIDNLKVSEKAIQAIMDKAKTIEEVLAVQQRLSDVQGQIEQLTAQLAGLTDKSAYSTLTVIFEVPAPGASPSPSPQPTATAGPWSAGEQFNQAAGELGGVAQSAATAAIWAVVLVLPVTLALLLLLIVLAVAARLLDPLRRRWLPFTVAQPAQHRQPGWGSPYPAGSPQPPAPATWPAAGGAAPPVEGPGSTEPGADPKKPKP
ncbi:MAG: DUF4349 domain-containing protein [Candidatus Limnocylindrales bacterium]